MVNSGKVWFSGAGDMDFGFCRQIMVYEGTRQMKTGIHNTQFNIMCITSNRILRPRLAEFSPGRSPLPHTLNQAAPAQAEP